LTIIVKNGWDCSNVFERSHLIVNVREKVKEIETGDVLIGSIATVNLAGDYLIIVATYSGGNYRTDEYYPTKLIIFDLNGDYLKTLDVEYKINDFCFDREKNRIIMSLNDVIQFAYLDIDGLI